MLRVANCSFKVQSSSSTKCCYVMFDGFTFLLACCFPSVLGAASIVIVSLIFVMQNHLFLRAQKSFHVVTNLLKRVENPKSRCLIHDKSNYFVHLL